MEGNKLNVYSFIKDGIEFFTNFPPDRNLRKQVINLFTNYDQYLHMKEHVTDENIDSNKDIIEAIYSLGVFKIISNTGYTPVTIFENKPKESFLRKDLIDYFNQYRNEFYRVGLITIIDNQNENRPQVIFVDWLPRMYQLYKITNIPKWYERYDIVSSNIIHVNGISYFVLFELDLIDKWGVTSYVEIGEDIFHKTSENYLNRTKMLQINSMSLCMENIYKFWMEKYNERRLMCGQNEIELTFYDLLIFLYQLQEFVSKVQEKTKDKILLWTIKHSEFNNEFREFNFPYNEENRMNILNAFAQTDEAAYGFINDFFYKKLI